MTDINWERAFLDYHAANPRVYADLRQLAYEAKRLGHRRVGVELLINRFRWDHPVKTDDPSSEFKINQNYAAYYARLLLVRNPDLRGEDGFWRGSLFNLRRIRDGEPSWSRCLWPPDPVEEEPEPEFSEQDGSLALFT